MWRAASEIILSFRFWFDQDAYLGFVYGWIFLLQKREFLYHFIQRTYFYKIELHFWFLHCYHSCYCTFTHQRELKSIYWNEIDSWYLFNPDPVVFKNISIHCPGTIFGSFLKFMELLFSNITIWNVGPLVDI